MNLETSFFKNLSLLFLTVLVFFGYLIGNLYIVLFWAFLITAFTYQRSPFSLDTENSLWIICLIVSIFSLIHSVDYQESLGFIFMIALTLVIKIIFEHANNWQDKLVHYFLVASLIHVIATVLFVPFPDIMSTIAKAILNEERYLSNFLLFSRGAYAGITEQTGVNAFFATVGIAIFFSNVFTLRKNKILNLIFLTLSIVAVLLTAKRSAFLINAIIIYIILFITNRFGRRKLLSSLFITLFIIGTGIFIMNKIPETQIIFKKYNILKSVNDISNGRYMLWLDTFEIFKNNLVWGTGINTIHTILNDGTHNIYLQLLAEVGIFGAILFYITFIYSFLKSTYYIKNIVKLNDVSDTIKRNLLISNYLQVFFFAYGFVGNPLYNTYFFVPYMICVAISKSYARYYLFDKAEVKL